MYGLELVSAPASEPVALDGDDGFKAHIRVTSSDDDALLRGYLLAAREYVETITGRQLVTASWRLSLDCFPADGGPIVMPKPPLASVSSVAYTDTDLEDQTLDPAAYQVDTAREPGRLAPASGYVWPESDPETLNAVRVTFTAGAATVSASAKLAIKLLAAHLNENREATIEQALSAIPYGLRSFLRTLRTGRLP
jgi:uncharacterized phiE125 gp8 family phage protein